MVRHRRQLVAELKVLRQRLHDRLNRLCPGLSAPRGHGRVLDLLRPSGRAVLACAVAFAGRPPSTRSLLARAPGRLRRASAEYWATRWRACLAPPADAELRAQRLALDLERLDLPLGALATADEQLAALLARTPGEVLTSLPGVAAVRAAACAAHSLPIERVPTAERLYSATGLGAGQLPVGDGRASRRHLTARAPEHRDALMAIAWGSRKPRPPFASARVSTAAAALHRCRYASPSPGTPAAFATRFFAPKSPTTRSAIVTPAGAGGDGEHRYAAMTA